MSTDTNVTGSYLCPCCKNPWNQSQKSCEMGFALACQPCVKKSNGYSGIDPSNFDYNVSLKDNFYLWSNGGWKSKNPVPSELSSWNTFIALRELNLDRLKSILEDLHDSRIESSEINDKLELFYNTVMDEAKIDSQGITPLLPIDPTRAIAQLHLQYGVNCMFRFFSSPDRKDSSFTIATVAQGGLGLPDRDYYFDEDKADKREKYLHYLTKVFSLLGRQHGLGSYEDEASCLSAARATMAIECTLAAAHLTRTQSRDPELTYNKMPVVELARLTAPSVTWPVYLSRGVPSRTDTRQFDWLSYFSYMGKPVDTLGDVNVTSIAALRAVLDVLSGHTREELRHYLVLHSVLSFSSHLSSDFGQAHFDFFEKELKGTQEMRPRWKRSLEALESALGDAMGQLYVKMYFSADSKTYALRIVEQVRSALRERLLEVEWMSATTRAEALTKMEKFHVKIGYPDQWIDFTSLHIQDGDHFQNECAARKFHKDLDLSRMNAPTDRDRWFMTPQTVNAYYHPSLNEIVFPAAILQPPFFDSSADEAVNFGSLGAVVGHEMTHGFDDQGRKYDSQGNMRDWWTAEDAQEYECRVDVMIRQAEMFMVHGVQLKGRLTCGENIADLGGVKLALRALKKFLRESDEAINARRINGLTPVQRLFCSWAQVWRENVNKERALQLVTLDPHGPNEFRCNGTLSNIEEFFEAFSISENDRMYRSVEERVYIW